MQGKITTLNWNTHGIQKSIQDTGYIGFVSKNRERPKYKRVQVRVIKKN